MGIGFPKNFRRSRYGNVAASALPGKPKRHSKLEASLEAVLLKRVKAGEITELKAQHRVTFRGTKKKKTYIVDFSALNFNSGEREYWEAKGFKTDDWGWKLVMWELHGPGLLHIYEGSYKNPVYVETIYPISPSSGVAS